MIDVVVTGASLFVGMWLGWKAGLWVRAKKRD